MRHLGRYLLEERLGSGAFATVWRGWDPDLETPVAVKVLADNWAVRADVCERFLSEARLLRRIADPAVVRVHDLGTVAGEEDELARPYFVMDLVTGGTLADLVGQLDPPEALELAAEAARAVQVLHEAGVVHRDVKPSNLLVADGADGRRRVVVADLGSAKLLADASGLTLVTGTPAYMAPEQARNDGGFDGRADVYAMGVVTYQLLSGRLPSDGDGRRTPTPMAAGSGLPRELDAVLATALAPEPEDRYASCTELAEALDAVREGRSSSRRTATAWRLAPVLAVALLVFVVAVAAGWWLR